jgi:Domain of unknown function (DUF4167)
MPRQQRTRRHKAARDGVPGQSQNAQRNYERYLELARAKAQSGDVVAAENYLQHAEHYLRSMREADGSRRNH